MSNRPSLDDIRAAFPKLGLAVYAFDPGGPVTLEVHAADGQVFPFEGPSFAAVAARAFPSLTRPPDPPIPEPAPTTTNVFD